MSIPRDVFGLAATGLDSETILMVGPESGVLRSEDDGRSFERAFEAPSGAVAVDRGSPDVVWVLTAAGLARSDDAGGTWEIRSTLDGVGGQPVTLAADGDELWLVTEEPRVLYHSEDSGGSWRMAGGT